MNAASAKANIVPSPGGEGLGRGQDVATDNHQTSPLLTSPRLGEGLIFIASAS